MTSPHPDDPLIALGQRLAHARVAAGFTVRAVADALKVSHSLIVRYERGNTLPPLRRLFDMALLYGISAAAMLASSDDAAPLIDHIDRAEPASLEAIRAAIQLDRPDLTEKKESSDG